MNFSQLPDDRIYTRDDLWLKREGQHWVVGLTDYGQNELGELVLVELKTGGAPVAAGDEVAIVESVKAISQVSSPLSGEIVAANGNVELSPELVNSSPLDAGWLFKIKGEAPKDALDATQYANWRRL